MNNLGKLLRDKSEPEQCNECGSDTLKYIGLGQYKCRKCNAIAYNSYGKARDCIEFYGGATVYQIMQNTDLTRTDIQDLVDKGFLSYASAGKLVI